MGITVRDLDGFQTHHWIDIINLNFPFEQTDNFTQVSGTNGSYGNVHFSFSYRIRRRDIFCPTSSYSCKLARVDQVQYKNITG